MDTEYQGSCYIGVVGSDLEYVECRDSIALMDTEPGDQIRFVRATKGYEARQLILNEFMATEHAFVLFLDQDQIFPQDTLTRLRSHGLPYVSGYYMRRRFNPIVPVWYEYPQENVLPYRAWTDEPERDKLHKLGASGWGCILVHRSVIEGVRKLLKGEPEILEDDMDLWPYDLKRIEKAIATIDRFANPDEVWDAVSALRQEIRPLRVDKEPVGSDIRFPFFAREAGFTLYGDPDVRCGHMTHYQLSPDDYTNAVNEVTRASIKQLVERDLEGERMKLAAAREALR